ncbi:MAG TPA: tannase/feruloyl esterase family alpha/beta hydrolase [Vicinamibacterales bacterium]|nr:tannase/feruloyl esterase family alpha/beta hydrolase [Vicinamibacterales bacterium]
MARVFASALAVALALAEPSHATVKLTLTPSSDSDIKVEVWMPANWNGKFLAVGNGAFSGSIAEAAMRNAVARGYATASTDTGHEGNTGSFALGHPEKAIDFGWRAVHEMTVAAKKTIADHYGTPPKLSYWSGCSAGGRQAMKEAQKFPADFDGIIAGAPGLDWTRRAAQAIRVEQALATNEAARLRQPERELLHRAVLDKCDALDGVKDGVIENPKACTFDPAIAGLTPAQVATARLMYASGLQPGSELGWTDLGWTASARATGLDQFRFLVFRDPSWTISAFNFDADLARAEKADADTINALDPNLRPFIARGGKLIQYHGWNDPQISPEHSVDYYRRVADRFGDQQKLRDSYRLFMAPGMAHCGGGEGPNQFDTIAALEQWVEHGKAPDVIVATRPGRTRPLCPYPQVATYKGAGSIDEAVNFSCSIQR